MERSNQYKSDHLKFMEMEERILSILEFSDTGDIGNNVYKGDYYSVK